MVPPPEKPTEAEATADPELGTAADQEEDIESDEYDSNYGEEEFDEEEDADEDADEEVRGSTPCPDAPSRLCTQFYPFN